MEGGQVGVYFEAAAVIVTLVLLGQVWSSARAVKPVRRFVHSWVLLPKPPPGLRDDGDMKTRSMLVELDVNNPNQLLAPGMFAEVQKSLTSVGLLIAGETWNVSALVGLIGLFGIAVQNSLVLVAQTRAFLAEGRPFRDALREASIGRVGPKIMTAATAILGLLPLLVLRMHGTSVDRRLK